MQQTTFTNNAGKQPCVSGTAKLVIAWMLVIVWAGFIFFLSANTGSDLSDGQGVFSQLYQLIKALQESLFGAGFDILAPFAHFFEYLIFTILLVNLLRDYLPFRRACLLAIMIASLYGVTDEVHQYFVLGRICDPLDWLVDTLGASIGAGIFSWCIRKRKKRP